MKNMTTRQSRVPASGVLLLTFISATIALTALAAPQLLPAPVSAAVARSQPVGRLAATNRLDLAIGLPWRNPEALARLLEELYDPAQPNRHYLTPEEFAARFGPTEQDYQSVIAFAEANGLTVRQTHPNRALLDVTGAVGDIEKALHIAMRVYRHPTEARTFYAPDGEPALDPAVPVLGISGLDNYALPRPRLKARPLGSGAGVSLAVGSNAASSNKAGGTPAPLLAQANSGSGPGGTFMGGDFRAAYLPGVALSGAGQVVGLLQFDGYTPSDITYYESHAGLPNVPLTNVLLDGFTGNPTGSGGEVEVSLDIEMAISMAPGLAGVMVYMAGPYGNWHDILNRMATDNLAKQLSCSWYSPGGGPDAVADQIFQQMAAQGQSFYNASGDYDAFTAPVDFPGETPYLVQVGGTTLTTSGPGGGWVSETVWNWGDGIGSGGGISTRYAIPSYQSDINMALNQGSTTMRNIPDVALTADNVYVRANAGDYNVGGTSCAAPLWAGFTALVNQQAVGGGRPPVGFVNPAVDAIGHAAKYTACFHDITTGNNTSSSSPAKFYAVAGYDLCTGWGTPAGQGLINALATPDPFLISPASLAFSGGVGGPFSPNPGWLTLTNAGTNALSWTLVNTSGWFDVLPTSGTLLPGGAAASVSVSVDASANALSPGVYTTVLTLTNQTSGVGQTIPLALSVAAPGMADNFDPGIDLTQWSSFGGVVGSTVLATNYGGCVSVSNSLWFGASGSRFAATVPINTSSGGQIGFCIRLANGAAWPWALVGNLPADGVVLECSTNGGGSWTAIGNYDTPAYYNWTGVALPIPALAQAPAALFRWRQLSNGGANYEHWALDNVIVSTRSMAPKIVMDPQSQNVAVGDPASLSVAAVGTPPLSYQWLLNGTNIGGATASSLAWAGVQLTDAGTYSVLVSNTLGSVRSSNAVLTTYIQPCAPPPLGLVSWWAGEGTAADSININNGTLVNGATFAAGEVGQAFSLNGTNQYVSVPDSASLRPANVTLECWVNFATIPGIGVLVAKPYGSGLWNSYCLWYQNGQLNGGITTTTLTTPVLRKTWAPVLGTWHHIAYTFDSGAQTQALYLDGVAVASGAVTGSIGYDNQPFLIGADISSGAYSYFHAGLLDEVSIYNRALGAAEVQAIYTAGHSGKCTTPSAPWILTQPANQTVTSGASAGFTVAAAGTWPLSYQWQFNGTNLAGATGSSLTLSNVQPAQAGNYAVQVTNAYGWAISSNALLTVNPLPPCAPPPAGLVSWWRGESNATDSINTNNGTLVNGAAFAAGEVGQAFSLNGINQYVSVLDSPSLRPTNVTLECWVNFATTPGTCVLVAKPYGSALYNSYALWYQNGQLNGGITTSTLTTPVLRKTWAPVLGTWHHVAYTFDSGAQTQAFYLDGVAVAVGTASGTIAYDTQPLLIGADISSGVYSYFDGGLLDEVSIYNRALTAAEIQAIYTVGSGGKCEAGTAPRIIAQPANQTVLAGSTATFSVTAAGTAPLSYQWQFSGTNLAGATGTSLTLSNVQAAQAGNYAVQVTNAYGWAISSNALLTVNPLLPCAPPPAGLISWWRGEGTATDSINTNNGTLVNGAAFATGEVGQAFSLNGINQYVAVPDSASLRPTNVTLECWVNFATTPGTCVFVAKPYGSALYNAYCLWYQNGQLNGGITTTTLTTPVLRKTWAPVLGTWHHIAYTFDRGAQTHALYLDGVAVVVGTASGMIAYDTQPLLIGADISSGVYSYFYGGLLDEVSIYNRALTAAEIQAIYNAGSAGKCLPAPSIQTPPQSQSVQLSSNATFSVTATGLSPLSYQWYFGPNLLHGATNTLLTLTNVGFAQAGNYTVVVTNAYGSATGGPAVLTVVDTIPPTIISCASNQNLSAGANCTANLPDLTAEVVASDASGPVTVTQNPPPGTQLGLGTTNVAFTAQDSSGNTSFCACSVRVVDNTPPFVLACVLEITLGFDTNCEALLPDLTTTNYIIARDNCSLVSVTQAPPALTAMPAGTNTVVLTVSDAASNQTTRAVSVIVTAPPRISVQPANLSAVLGSNAVFSVTACGSSPLVYQWQHAGTNLLAGTNAVLILGNLQTNAAGDYQVLITNSAGSITSAVATLTVLQPPVITWQPESVVAAPGATVSFWVEADGREPMTYVWQKNGKPMAGCTEAWLTITNAQTADFAGYTVGITNSDGGVLSEAASLRLAASPRISSLSFNLTTFMLTVPTEVGPSYVVEYKDTLADPAWHELTTLAGTGSSIPISDNGLTNTMRFYRVRVR